MDKEYQITADIKNWSINTSGNGKSSLFSVPQNTSEFNVVSTSDVYIQKIVVGFLSVDNIKKSNIFPHSVDCYGGDNKNGLIFLGTLNLIDDQYFSNHNTRVYGLNLNRLKNIDGSWIKNTFNRGIKYLKFKINKPNLISVADVL